MVSGSAQVRSFSILIALYVAQGLPFGFFTQAMPALMRQEGVDLKYIGLMSLLALPWALKFLWAPFLDGKSILGLSHRKGWILLANILAVCVVLCLAMMPLPWWLGSGIVWLMLLILCMNLFAASQDISTDALAVESIEPQKRGLANAVQVSGYRVGMVLGGGFILAWLPVLGWQWAMVVMAVLLLVSGLSVLFWQSESVPATTQTSGQSIKGLFARKGVWVWFGFLILYKAGDAFGTAMLKPMLIDRGYSLADIAWLLGTWGVMAGLVGAVVGGLLIKPLGRFKALVLFALLQCISLSLYGLYAKGLIPESWFVGVCILEHVTGAMATIAIFTLMMDYCRESHAGLDYSFQSCLIVVGGLLMASFSGFSAQYLGYFLHFMLAASITLLAFVWAYKARHFMAVNVSTLVTTEKLETN
jgi:predicted MFS family arabinose efflux permease